MNVIQIIITPAYFRSHELMKVESHQMKFLQPDVTIIFQSSFFAPRCLCQVLKPLDSEERSVWTFHLKVLQKCSKRGKLGPELCTSSLFH